MGTFQGHLLPGAFFIAFALWWTVLMTRRWVTCALQHVPFYCSVTYAGFSGRVRRWPQEGMFKIAATSVGMILELLAATDWGHAGRIVSLGDLQHVTMYMFFCLSGVVDVLTHCGLAWLPPGTDYAASVLAFLAEFVLFRFHLHGRSALDVQVHVLLLCAVAVCAGATAVELAAPPRGRLLAGYVRAWAVLLQGTWFVQVGTMLYPPLPALDVWRGPDADADVNLTLATMMFTWHAAADVIIIMAIAAVARTCYTRSRWCRPRVGTLEWEVVRAESATVEAAAAQTGGGVKGATTRFPGDRGGWY